MATSRNALSAPVLSLSLLSLTLLLAGCGSGSAAPPIVTPIVATPTACKSKVAVKTGPIGTANYGGIALTGRVAAGAAPVAGASVQLYAAGSTGLGSAATALGTPATTSAGGTFSIAASYTCPNSLSLLYLVARGGSATAGGASNANTVLLTTLGACNAIATGTATVIDEATTVASAYAFAQFLAAGGNIGATATNFRGLGLAAASAANLVNPTTGQAPGATFPATAMSSPVGNVNALANALNACVANAVSCAPLYAAATVAGGAAPTNTLDVLRNIALNPGVNVAAVFAATQASAAYPLALAAAPTDWTLFVSYGGGALHLPTGIAIDSTGIVWVASYINSIFNAGSASQFSNTGTPQYPNGVGGFGLYDSYGIAVDYNDNVWIPNELSLPQLNAGVGSVSVFNTAGASQAGITGYLAGGLNYPVAVAIDTAGTSWIVDYNLSHVTLLANDGTPLSGPGGYASNQFIFPVAVAVDSKCYGYIGNQSSNTITKLPPDGSSFTSYVTGSGASGLAVDQNDNVWTANYYGNSIGQLSANGTIVSSGYTNAALSYPQGIAIDGAGHVWVANFRAKFLAELAGSSAAAPGSLLSPAGGYGADAALVEAFALAIDASGNIWVSNYGSNTITEFVGLAAPVRTPMIGPVVAP